jgi:glycosyltransferase involved in cell wall biosynthesis
MKANPLISIITPTYNHEQFIEQCIESVLNQTYPYWEQIIIDDGSCDRTADMVAKYRDNRIKYIKQDNIGIWRLSETYNRALKMCQGELVAILEGDDFWPKDKLEMQVKVFSKGNIVLSWGNARVVNNKSHIIYTISNKNMSSIDRIICLKNLLYANYIPACTVICRKDALLDNGGFKQAAYTPYVDHPTWLDLCLCGDFCYVNEILGFWRQHSSQTSAILEAEMAQASKYSIEFFDKLPVELKAAIGINIHDLERNNRNIIANSYLYSGRVNLSTKNWDEAKRNLKNSFKTGDILIKGKSLFGLVCCFCRINMEWAARFLNRHPLNH